MAATARATKNAPAVDPDDGVPEFTTKAPKPPVGAETVTLFKVDGKAWTTPKARDFGAVLRYLNAARKGSLRNAELDLIERLIGPDGVAALLRATDIDPDRWEAVVTRGIRVLLGQPEPDPSQGN